jgi:cardiolipin synthase
MSVYLWIALEIFFSVLAVGHALLHKRDARAALGWVAVSLIFPFVGPLLYFVFGVNRVLTRARQLGLRTQWRFDAPHFKPLALEETALESSPVPGALRAMARVSDTVTGVPLVAGNRLEMLVNGDQAYPLMLEAIDAARRRIFLTTYIFESNRTGRRFIDALAAAVKRGVEVRVIIDGIGEYYSWPRAGTLLKRRRVPVTRFLPPRLMPPTLQINLRNHRKLLAVDGRIGFIGGMNIGDRHVAAIPKRWPKPMRDVHFKVIGPVIHQLEQCFIEDWRFCTGQRLELSPECHPLEDGALCRAIVEGPNEDLAKLASILGGAIAAAHRRIALMTPYFLPPRSVLSALQTAALRGVRVDVVLPRHSNLPYVDWATRNMLWELLKWGARVYWQPPPFSHTKLFVVDGTYAQIGSANIDSRSLRLNFELNLEIFDPVLSARIERFIDEAIHESSPVSIGQLDGRPLPIKLRDAAVWLFSPYL